MIGLVWLTALIDARAWLLLRNTLVLSASACCLALPIGLPVAWLLSRTDAWGRHAVRAVTIAMLFMPLYLQAAGWDAGLGRQGWLPSWSGWPSRLALAGWPAAIWIHALAAVPWIVLVVSYGLRMVEPELEETALLDLSVAQVAWRVSLRRALPAVAIAALWVFVLSSQEIAVTDLYQIRTYAEEIYTYGPAFGLGSLASAESGIAWAGDAAVLLLLLLVSFCVTAYALVPQQQTAPESSRTIALGGGRLWGGIWLLLTTLVIAGIPCLNLLVQAGITVQRTGDHWLRVWSGGKIVTLLGRALVEFRQECFWSLLIAGIAATSALTAGVLCAGWLRRALVGHVATALIVSLGLAVPGPLIGIGIVKWLQLGRLPVLLWLYENSLFAPVVAQTWRALPIAALICWHALRSVPQEMREAAAIDGATFWGSLWRVELPMRGPALAAAWLAAFTISMGELSATNLTAPPGVFTLPTRVFGLLHAGVDDVAAAVCLLVMAATMLSALLITWLLGRPAHLA
jgi:iron(III) transport system permease protein